MTAPVHDLPGDAMAPGTDLVVGSRPAGAPAARDGVAHPLVWTMAAFAAIALAVWLVVWWSVLHPPAVTPVGTPVPGAADLPTWLRGWVHWDAGNYDAISRDGYSYQPGVASTVAFFPLYPMLIRLLSAAGSGSSSLVAGIGLTLAAGTAGIALLWTWCRSRVPASTATTAVLLLAVYPYAIYLYGPVYADALFFAGVLGAFVLLERDHVLAATLVGAAAGAARPAGLILAVALLIRLVEIRAAARATDPVVGSRWARWFDRWNPGALRPRDRIIVGSSGGFLAYCIYLDARFGDPFAFATTQGAPGWDQPAGPTTWFKSAMIAEIQRDPWGPAAIGLVVQAALVVLVLVAAPFVGRRIGWAYAWFMVLIAGMVTLGSKDFQGAGRYLIPAMAPVALLAAGVLDRHRVARVVAVASGFVALCFFASWFAKGNYLA